MRLYKLHSLFVCLFFVLLLCSFPSYSAVFNINTFDDAVDASPGDGVCNTINNDCSLRAAVMESNALPGADRIILPTGGYTLTIGNTGEDKSAEGDLDIFDDLSIEGAVDGQTVISGNKVFRLLSVLETSDGNKPTVNLTNLTLTQGLENNPNDNASVILSLGLLYLDNIIVEQAGAGSVAIVSVGAYLQIINSQINNNDRAIFALKSQLNIKDTEIKQNVSTVKFLGAGIISDSSRVSLINVDIVGNSALTAGGGISATQSSKFSIVQSNITNNSASDDLLIDKTYGGGLYFIDSDIDIKESFIMNNNATTAGGGIWFKNGRLSIKKTEITSNSTDGGGAGLLYVGASSSAQTPSELKITESKVTNNKSGVIGGGILITQSDRANNLAYISRTEVSDNNSETGAGIVYFDLGTLSIQNTTISNNQANQSGGGLYILPGSSSEVEIQSTTIASNSATTGANIYNINGSVSLANSIVANGIGSSDCNTSLTSEGFNLDSDNSCGLSVDLNDKPGEDPLLGILADNGGFTRTHALLDKSPAIDAGDDLICEALNTLDQRNYYRGNTVCDIGAMEFDSALALTGEIEFVVNQIATNENSGSVDFSIKRINGSEGSVSVYVYPISSSSAKINDDYFLNASIVSWADGDTEDKILTARLIDNDIAGGNSTIIVSMGSPEGNVSLAPEQKLVINVQDDELLTAEIEFAQSEFIVSESKSLVILTVVRKNSLSGAVTFKMQSAIFDVIEATIQDGQRGFIFEIPLDFAQDAIYDGDQTVKFSLSDVSSNATIGTISTTNLIIKDDETRPVNPGVITFENTSYSVNEKQRNLLVSVLRKEGQEGKVYVDLELISDTAKFSSDFGGINNSNKEKVRLLIENGQDKAVVSILIENDNIAESEETFQIKLSNPLGGASIGDFSLANVKIIDDDVVSNVTKGINTDSRAKSSSGATDSLFLILLFSLGVLFRSRLTFRKYHYFRSY